MTRLREILQSELGLLRPRLYFLRLLFGWLPRDTFFRVRNIGLRATGADLPHTVTASDWPTFSGSGPMSRLHMGYACYINRGCHFNLEADIYIGDRVSIGHEVLFVTGTHEVGPAERRATNKLKGYPIRVGNGVWLGSRCTILPKVTVGDGAIVGAGAVVNRDVPSHTVVGGVPARVLKNLPPD